VDIVGGLFREKVLDRVSSPEQINECIKAPDFPSAAVLGAVLVLLAGALVWGLLGRMDMTLGTVAVCEDGNVVCCVPETDMGKIGETPNVRVGEETLLVTGISDLPIPVKGNLSDYEIHVGGFMEADWVYVLYLDGSLEDGIYEGSIVLKSVSPMTLLFG